MSPETPFKLFNTNARLKINQELQAQVTACIYNPPLMKEIFPRRKYTIHLLF